MSDFIYSVSSALIDDDGNQVGLANTKKQMLGQRPMTGVVKLTINKKKFTCNLNGWQPARNGLGWDGEAVQPNTGNIGEILHKYGVRQFDDETAAYKEASFLISWLALSVLNGRPPTSGALNTEMSHKANQLFQYLEVDDIAVETVTMPGPVNNGVQLPDFIIDGSTLYALCEYYRRVSAWMLGNLSKPRYARQTGMMSNSQLMDL